MDIYIAIRYVAKYGSMEIIGCRNGIDDCNKLVHEHADGHEMDSETWEWKEFPAIEFEHNNVEKMYGHVDTEYGDTVYHVYEIQKHELPDVRKGNGNDRTV